MKISNMVQDHHAEILRIAASHGARHVRLFGSLARDESRPDSDMDILMQLDSGRSLLDLIAIQQDLEDFLGCKVDVVTEAAISPYIRGQILKEAVTLRNLPALKKPIQHILRALDTSE